MSIEYFVEGNVRIESGGDYLAYSKENIVNNATESVNQKGNQSGVSYNKNKEIHEWNKPVNTINVSLNLFFDGTQNNKRNTQTGKDYKKSNHKDDSYTNDYSNVARGFDALNPAAKNQVRYYIEGIGTENLKSDDVFPDVALGIGNRGVIAKVTKGCIEGAKAVGSKFKRMPKEIKLTVNVFGFSRGATAARHFIYVATSPAKKKGGLDETINGIFKTEFEYILPPLDNYNDGEKKVKRDHPLTINYGYFGACLLSEEVIPVKIKFNFVGLYDTVASYGLNHRGGWGINDDTKQLVLDAIGSGRVHFVLQLTADDEYRDNFDLTNINSAGLYGLEFTLPGVHSDIGGSYVNGDEEIVDIYNTLTKLDH